MAAIVPITAVQTTDQSTLSGSFVNVPGTNTAVLAGGVDYLVIYRGQLSGDNTNLGGELALVLGPAGNDTATTKYGQIFGAAIRPNTVSDTGATTSHKALVTGNGVDVLKFQHRVTGGTTVYSGALAIIAIPLDQLTVNSDYFWAEGANTDTLTSFGNVFADALSATFTLPDNGDYLVMLSTEFQFLPGNSTMGAQVRGEIDGVSDSPQADSVNGGWYLRYRNAQSGGAHYMQKLVNLSSGPRTFKVQARSSSATFDIGVRRPRIAVIRAASFDQLVATTLAGAGAGGETTGTTTYNEFNDITTVYTPNQAEDVVVLANTSTKCSSDARQVRQRLRNTTDATMLIENCGRFSYGNTGANTDSPSDLICGVSSITAAPKTFMLEYALAPTAFVTGRIGRNQGDTNACEQSMVVWSMELAVAPPAADEPVIFFGAAA